MKQQVTTFMQIGAYFLTPEDSRDTVYRSPLPPYTQQLPHYIERLKLVFWIGMALLASGLISMLQ
ncbi:hypothetical protein U27_06096 [Candidatus Vecturithrix granuli]|uniref:Uncharacterized protein n=1 Tax=Vecturithrix granuli TaxID=1499967 RepID=A0A081C3G5_VECG1|nr:hypothetical protein U27_06096 [Candidatus Vecturithrix granuli]